MELSGTAVVSVGGTNDTVIVVVNREPVDMVDVSGTTRGLEVFSVVVVLSVTGTAGDHDIFSVYTVVVGMGEVVVSAVFVVGGGTVVVENRGILYAGDSVKVTFIVTVRQSVVSEIKVDVAGVVGATWEMVVAVEVVLSVVIGCGVASGVILLVVKVGTSVADSVDFSEGTVGKDVVPVSTGEGVERGEVVVELVIGKPGRMRIGVFISMVAVVVLVPVVVVLGTVVLSVTAEVSKIIRGTGVDTVTVGIAANECVVVSVVSSFGCTPAEVVTVAGLSAVVVGCGVEGEVE